jgi:hypothetical protein
MRINENAPVKFFATIVFAISLSTTNGANAQKLDLSDMTCASFLQTDKDTSKQIIAWLSAFYTEETSPQIVDLAALNELQKKFTDFCKLEPTFHISIAAEGLLGLKPTVIPIPEGVTR